MTSLKYSFIKDDVTVFNKYVARRIVATRSFGDITAGTLGGYIDEYSELSHDGNCWLSADSLLLGGSKIKDDAIVSNGCTICDDSVVGGNAVVGIGVYMFMSSVTGNASVNGIINIRSNCEISGNAKIEGKGSILDDTVISGDVVLRDKFIIRGSIITHPVEIGGDFPLITARITSPKNFHVVVMPSKGESATEQILLYSSKTEIYVCDNSGISSTLTSYELGKTIHSRRVVEDSLKYMVA